jgi:hypothetical protein
MGKDVDFHKHIYPRILLMKVYNLHHLEFSKWSLLQVFLKYYQVKHRNQWSSSLLSILLKRFYIHSIDILRHCKNIQCNLGMYRLGNHYLGKRRKSWDLKFSDQFWFTYLFYYLNLKHLLKKRLSFFWFKLFTLLQGGALLQ